MPSKARYKTTGGDKDFADKITFNPPSHSGKRRGSQTRRPDEQKPGRKVGQFSDQGQPPLIKK